MNFTLKIASAIILPLIIVGCNSDDTTSAIAKPTKIEEGTIINPLNTNFLKISDLNVSNQGVPEISAYDSTTKTVFTTNTEAKVVEVINITDVNNPTLGTPIDITAFGGNLNSVAVSNGLLAIAIEGNDKAANKGKIVVFKTNNLTTPYIEIEAGYLPDMVIFTPNGEFILSANEGEPNSLNTIDPEGSITIINVNTKTSTTLLFDSFNSQETTLKNGGFRVFGKTNNVTNALNVDVEPEYIAISNDSKTAYITLQENNGIAVVDILSMQITEILPLGYKDFNNFSFDVSDKDNKIELNSWNVKSFYQPDAIDYFTVNNTGYLITANEGDARDYDGFSEEERVEDLILDPTAYPNANELQLAENLGRLKVTNQNGDFDNDGDIDQIYGYGGRSFSIWTTAGNLVYDSGNFLAEKTIELGSYPEKRSDDKGTEPESVITYETTNNVYAFVGLERSGDVFIFDITTPSSPIFLTSLENTSPEGLLFIPASESPNGNDLFIVSNEFPDKEFVVDENEGGTFGKLVIYSN